MGFNEHKGVDDSEIAEWWDVFVEKLEEQEQNYLEDQECTTSGIAKHRLSAEYSY